MRLLESDGGGAIIVNGLRETSSEWLDRWIDRCSTIQRSTIPPLETAYIYANSSQVIDHGLYLSVVVEIHQFSVHDPVDITVANEIVD